MRVLRLDVQDGCPVSVHSVSPCLTAHKANNRGLIHVRNLPWGRFLLGLGMIHNGWVHEHATIRQNPVEVALPGT